MEHLNFSRDTCPVFIPYLCSVYNLEIMIRNILGGFLILTSGILAAQSSPNYVLVEHFTNTYCSICNSRNPALYGVMDKYDAQIHHISYHPSVPYNQCPLYNYNRDGNKARQDYYGVFSTPTMYINGNRSSSNASQFEGDLANQMVLNQKVRIIVDEGSSRSRSVVLKIATEQSVPSGNYRLFVALAERYLEFDANNGEKEHFDVFRTMITSNDGDPLDLPMPGEEIVLQFEATVPTDISNDEAYVIAYIQNEETKDVVGSGTKFDQVSTSLEEAAMEIGLSMYPNPADVVLEVELGSEYQIHRYVILDVQGGHMRERKMSVPEKATTIDLLSMLPGTYLLQIDYGSGLINQRFVKL